MLENHRNRILHLALILVVTTLAFGPTLKSGFVNWDDDYLLVDNQSVQQLDWIHIQNIFTSRPVNIYSPLTSLSFAIENHFFDLNPFIYHLDNLILHLAVTALAFFFLMRLGLSVTAASIATLLFAIHPMHVESVAWVSQRKDVLYAFFYLLALNFYWEYLRRREIKLYLATILFGVLSMLAKSMALSLPLIMLLCDWFSGRKRDKWVLIDKIPHLVYVVAIGWLTFSINREAMGFTSSVSKAILIFIWSVTFYFHKFIWPFDLSPIYQVPYPISIGNPVYQISLLIFAILIGIIFYFRKNRWVVFAFLFQALSIFFLWRFKELTNEGVVADRFMYLPSLGFCMLVGQIAEKGMRGQFRLRYLAVVGLIILFAILGNQTYRQCQIWKDGFTLWTTAIQKNPDVAIAYNNLGVAYAKIDDYEPAISHFDKALTISPNLIEALYNRGNLEQLKKEYDSAIADYSQILKNSSDKIFVYNNRGTAYMAKKMYAEAIDDFDRAISLNPKFAQSYFNRGNAYKYFARYDHALEDYNQAIKINPQFVNAHQNRGNLLRDIGQLDLAIADYNYGLRLEPQSSGIYFSRSKAYRAKGDFSQAYQDALRAKSLGYPVDDKYIRELFQKIPR